MGIVSKSENDFNVSAVAKDEWVGNLLVKTDYELTVATDNGNSARHFSFNSEAELLQAWHSTIISIEFTMDKMLDR